MSAVIHGYKVEGEFRQLNGGRCLWTFCHDAAGQKFFIKRYLSPKYPLDEPKSADVLNDLRVCQAFEDKQATLMMELKRLPRTSNYLVAPVDFFRERASYYKVTPWIEYEQLTRHQVSRLSADYTYSIMLTTLDALSVLHSILRVHGDVKFDNNLIKRNGASLYIVERDVGRELKRIEESYYGNLIDFDDCFTFGNPPGKGSLACDLQYMSPETLRYVTEKDPETAKELGVRLKGGSDIFSLGLLFHEYWTGGMPEFDKLRFQSPAAAVAARKRLRVGGPYMPRGVADLIKSMLVYEPDIRPDVWKVTRRVQDLQKAQPKTRVMGRVLRRLLANVA